MIRDFSVYALNQTEGYRIYLAFNEQMDWYLNQGFTLWYEDANKQSTLLASPEDGFLMERPSLEIRVSDILKGGIIK